MRDILKGKFLEFLQQSNEIEGIKVVSNTEMHAAREFMENPISVENLVKYVEATQPNAIPRWLTRGVSVFIRPNPSIGTNGLLAPREGPHIKDKLKKLLKEAEEADASKAYNIHCRYESLHPFTDGNGRSGRLVWAWMMIRSGYKFERLFLHIFYYQSLNNFREVK